jgi:hypothetical protein
MWTPSKMGKKGGATKGPSREEVLLVYGKYVAGGDLKTLAESFCRSKSWLVFQFRKHKLKPAFRSRKKIYLHDGKPYVLDDTGYYRSIKRNGILLHREIWQMANGPIPEGHEIHHVNGNKIDNRKENLVMLNKHSHLKKHGGFSGMGKKGGATKGPSKVRGNSEYYKAIRAKRKAAPKTLNTTNGMGATTVRRNNGAD